MVLRAIGVALLLLILSASLSPLSLAQVSPSEIGVALFGFEELTDFLVEASAFSEMERVKWYGSDGSALSEKVIKTPAAARLAAKGVWKNTITFSVSDIAVKIYFKVKDAVGYAPDPYVFISYDALWVLALATVAAGDPKNVDKISELIPKITEIYEGASGKIVLNENGDRKGSDYAVFAVKEVSPGKFEWRAIQIYDFAKKEVRSLEDPFANRPPQLPDKLPSIDMAKFRALVGSVPATRTEVVIGALYPLSGDLGGMGKANIESLKIALEDLNKWLAQNGFPYSFKLEIRDTQTKGDVAESQFRTLYGLGIRLYVGPMSSGELGRVMGAIDGGLKSVVISPSSTSPALAKKDTVYRFPPPDELQAEVIAEVMKSDKVKKVIIVYRSDDWGEPLAKLVEEEAKKRGMEVVKLIGYDPNSPQFKSVAEQVRGEINRLTGGGEQQLLLIAAVAIVVLAAAAYFLFLRKK